MAGTLRQGQSEFFQLPACQHGSDLRCRPSPTARLELLDTNTGLPAGPLYLLGVIPLIQQRPLPPGFRSTFRDWAGEETDHPREVFEAALAHVVRNRVEAAYARSDLFERRRVLMDDWARYLAQGPEQDGSTISASGGQARGVK